MNNNLLHYFCTNPRDLIKEKNKWKERTPKNTHSILFHSRKEKEKEGKKKSSIVNSKGRYEGRCDKGVEKKKPTATHPQKKLFQSRPQQRTPNKEFSL
ncbi:hypothetical protein CDAR_388891 [Caerostris darwini]|uniref:Uncharacterized protein n=1 Tax=Caerostris darwini TaxID=1538125 RepID=A0AAV4S7F7_9ARAC|nr:hypothetical protein CDAR_388891 [Caerostris darwini]